jgi:uncharacterized surface protein with fasciclin (FAS1) repeats
MTTALVLALSAASQAQADPLATDSLPRAVTADSSVAMTSSVRPDDVRRDVASKAFAAGLGDLVDGAGSVAFFGSLLRAASLGDLLDLGGEYTLFVPVDAAFSRMTGQQISDLIHDPESLRSLVAAHIVPERVLVTDLKHGRAVFAISGDRIEPSPAARPQLNGATLIRTALAGPIMVHIIDGLLQRPKPSDA